LSVGPVYAMIALWSLFPVDGTNQPALTEIIQARCLGTSSKWIIV